MEGAGWCRSLITLLTLNSFSDARLRPASPEMVNKPWLSATFSLKVGRRNTGQTEVRELNYQKHHKYWSSSEVLERVPLSWSTFWNRSQTFRTWDQDEQQNSNLINFPLQILDWLIICADACSHITLHTNSQGTHGSLVCRHLTKPRQIPFYLFFLMLP